MESRNCVTCSAPFAVRHRAQSRCKPCQSRWRNVRLKKYTKACNRCGEQYQPRDTRSKTCPACRVSFPCKICGQPAKRKSTGSLYCSTRCGDRAKLIAKHGHANHLEALRRDNFACVKCASVKQVAVHHIDGAGLGYERTNRNNAMSNLVTLCNSCHGKIHSLTARRLYAAHPETVLATLNEFLHSS